MALEDGENCDRGFAEQVHDAVVLEEDLADVEGRISHSEELLSGQFAERAPEHVVQRERDKLAELRTEWEKLKDRLEALM